MASKLLSGVRAACSPRERLFAAGIAVLAGLAVFLVADQVFPYHSSNHDEAVYLQQASMLLEGQFRLDPGALGGAVRPWFFVAEDGSFYPKYQPLPAGLYAVSMALFGEPRVTLAAVTAANTTLVYVLGSMAFDRRIGLLAAVAFASAPLTLVTSSVFLPYAPTTLFNLSFAVAYLHGFRNGTRWSGLLAGGAIGTAFFMRPFTAVLFAAPFLLHAAWEVLTALRGCSDGGLSSCLRETRAIHRQGATAAVGLACVALTLAYNASLTGSALVFPYEAFAPLDGPGFGERRILDHSVEYTPDLAVRSNLTVLWYLVTRWVPGGALGSVLAVVGLYSWAARATRVPFVNRGRSRSGDGTAGALLAGLFVSIPLGNVFFWGNHNILATPGDPTDGLLGQFGPFYHFDLLAPVAIFGAAGAITLWRQRGRLFDRVPVSTPGRGRAISVSVLLAALLITGGVNAALVSGPLDRNEAHTETYEQAYAPFEERSFDGAAVFVPTPYGGWLNHPFQHLRNDPDFDGSALYVLDRSPAENFAVIDALPDRDYYRYTFRGEWTADPDERAVVPRLERLRVHEGRTLDGETTVGVPDRISHAVVRLDTTAGHVSRTVEDPRDSITIDWSLDPAGVSLDRIAGSTVQNGSVTPGQAGAKSGAGNGSVDSHRTDEVVLTVRLVQSGAGTLTYRQAAPVERSEQGVSVLWPPERTVCPVVDDCGREGTYLPAHPDQHREGVRFETYLTAGE